jgi:hypothetical protein
MSINRRRVASFFAEMLLVCIAGCSNFSSIKPGDPADSITDRVGDPTTVWKNEDGSELWQYPQGHYSTQTFVVSIGSDQRVKEVYQALSEPYFSKVGQGMSREDVQRLLGPPREVRDFPSRDEESWSWRYTDVGYMQFNVIFDRTHDRVKRVQRLQEVPPRTMRR